MELTKEQILQIDNYVFVSGIKYYDVRAEIVDHFANILEKKLDKNPSLDFKKEIQNIHKNFSDNGFSLLLKQKTKSIEKNFYKDSLKHLITFFRIPKIILTAALFLGLNIIMGFFEDKSNFFFLLLIIGFSLTLILAFKTFKIKTKEETFLSLGMTMNFFQIFHICVILLQNFNNRSLESLSISTYNYIHIAAYVLLFLFYWSGEYIYSQNKKLVKKQYPNVIV